MHGFHYPGSKPISKEDKPVGEWNTFRIILKGKNVTVYLNGKLVVANQPWADRGDLRGPLPAKGVIGLRSIKMNPIWFKNIYIKELPD